MRSSRHRPRELVAARDEFVKDLHPLRHELELEFRDPGDVAVPKRSDGRRRTADERTADAVVGAPGPERGPGREGHGSRVDAVVAGGRDEDRARRHEPEATAREDGHEVADAPGQNRRRTQAWTW